MDELPFLVRVVIYALAFIGPLAVAGMASAACATLWKSSSPEDRVWFFRFIGMALAAGFVLATCGCSGREAPSTPRPLQGIGPGQPALATCADHPCWCAEPPTGYSAYPVGSGTLPPVGHRLAGTRTVTVVSPWTSEVLFWPAVACGDSMAARYLETGCWQCVEDRYVVTDFLRYVQSAWPDSGKASFGAVPGKAYWVATRRSVEFVDAGEDTVVVSAPS